MKTMIEELSPKWGPIGPEVYGRTYSRDQKDGTKEDWINTVPRTVDGNLELVHKKYIQPGERKALIRLFYMFDSLPAGRHLWASGVPGRQFLFNCHHSGWTRDYAEHIAFTFDELMKGGGVGTNYSNRYIKSLPKVKFPVEVHVVCSPDHADYEKFKHLLSTEYSHTWTGAYRCPDTREGWVESGVQTIRNAFEKFNEVLVIDVSLVREEGKPIKGFGGTASGPGPLVEMLVKFGEILTAVYNGGTYIDKVWDEANKKFAKISYEFIEKTLTTASLMLLDHELGRCVVSGNVRRSARMSLKHWRDDDIFEFISCKHNILTHWTTNISVEYDNAFIRALNRGDKHAHKVMDAICEGMVTNGEPGLWNYSKSQQGELREVSSTNPCGEICLEPFENCNLGHVNLGAFYDDPAGAHEAARLMTRFLIRATFGDVTDPKQREVLERNRRIGVGIFGYQAWCVKQGIKFSESYHDEGVKKFLRELFKTIRKTANKYSFQLRIPSPIKVTTIAPTGTIAKLPGTTEGCQSIMYRYGKRRVIFSTSDPDQAKSLKEFKKKGYEVKKSVYQSNSEVVSFLYKDVLVEEAEQLNGELKGVKVDELIEEATEISIDDYLGVQSMLQEEYSDNAISITINIPKDAYTAKQLKETIVKYLPRIKGMTIMPEVSRPQIPYERISKKQWEKANGLGEIGQGEMECQGACPVK